MEKLFWFGLVEFQLIVLAFATAFMSKMLIEDREWLLGIPILIVSLLCFAACVICLFLFIADL